jgi:DNA-directed RNA polymerase subunit RPC12/RpoP
MTEGIQSPKIISIGKMYACQHCGDTFYVQFTKDTEKHVEAYLKCEKCGSVNVKEDE